MVKILRLKIFFSLSILLCFNIPKTFSQCTTSTIPVLTTGCTSGDFIDSFVLDGVPAIGNSGCTTGANAYESFSSPVWNLVIGNTYNWSATNGAGLSQSMGIWIDLNSNNEYEASEFVGGTPAATSHTGSFTIPLTTIPGLNVRMRVRCRWSTALAPTDACLSYAWGETEDYFVNLIAPTACSGVPTAGTASASDVAVCPTHNFTLNLTGFPIESGRSYQWEYAHDPSGPWNPLIGSTGISTTVSQNVDSWYRCIVTCTNSNLSDISNIVAVGTYGIFPGGTYTIGPSGNFPDFTSAIQAISCGISGQVTFNVEPNSGPYNEQIVIPQISGASVFNSIIINGNGNTIISPTSAANNYIIRLNGADHFTFNDLVLQSTSSADCFAFHLTNNADSNVINNCTIDLSSTYTTTGLTVAGIAISGTNTSATTAGNTGTNNVIVSTTIKGGYYGITMIGNSASAHSANNFIINCNVEDFYVYGIYMVNVSSTSVSGNNISRPLRSSVSTFYGIYHGTGGNNNSIEKNRIFDAYKAAPVNTSTSYGIFHTAVDATSGNENIVSNNLIYNINNNGSLYGLYNSSSDFIKYFHNTVSIDDPTATAGLARGFFQTLLASGIEFKNNIISISRGGSGDKHCLYFGTATSTIVSNNNNLYINAPAGNNFVGFYSTAHATLTNWQAANSSAYDQASVSLDPIYQDTATGNFSPLNFIFDNQGAPVGISSDILGVTRNSTTPDIGAYEFTQPEKDLEITLLSTTLFPCFAPNDTMVVELKSIGSHTLDFSVNNLEITWNISGPSTLAGTTIVNTGTLAPGASFFVELTNAANLSLTGSYQIMASITSAWDELAFNNLRVREIINSPVNISAASDSVCYSSPAILNLTGTASQIQWQVDIGSGFSNIPNANSSTLSHTITSNADFRAMYCGTNISDTVSIIEFQSPAPVVQNDTVCSGQTATLNATASGPIYWFDAPSGGNVIGTGSVLSIQPATTTTVYAQVISSDQLLTTVAGGNSCQGGNMFNVTSSSNSLTIHGFDVSLTVNATQTLNVYYIPGGFQGQETNPTAWTQVGSYTVTASSVAVGTLTTFSCSDILIPAGQTYGIYIEGYFHYTTLTAPGATYSDANISIFSGVGLCSAFGGLNNPRGFNGKVHYRFGCESIRVPVEVVVKPLPVIALGSDTAFCQGGSVTLDATYPGAVSYNWNNGLSTLATIQASNTGLYIASVTDADGCTGKDTVVITVNPLPNIFVNANPPAVCQGSPLTLTATGAPTLSWDNNVVNGQSFIPASTATYTVTGTNANNCSNSSQITVDVNPVPVVGATASSYTLCYGNSLTLSGTGADSYSWDNNVADGQSFTPVASANFTVTGTNAFNCSATAQIAITVNPVPIVSASASAMAVCAGNPVTVNGSGALTYSWDNSVTDGVPFMPANTQTYTVTGTNSYNCTGNAHVTIIVHALPNVVANASTTSICAGGTLTLTGSGANSYSWSNNIFNGVPFIPALSTTYTVTGTDANGCTNTESIAITVNQLPTVSLASFTPTCIYSEPFELYGGQPSGGVYTAPTGMVGNLFSPALAGIGHYVITYTFTDPNTNCSNNAVAALSVGACTGIENQAGINNLNSKIYPNPASSRVILEMVSPENGEAKVILIDARGKIVTDENIHTGTGVNKIDIHTGNLARGIYFLRLVMNDNIINHRVVLN